jgi:WhiB family redox-sensing transcriptional regulator
MDWREKAACLGMDTELFFPIGESGPGFLQETVAKNVCSGCDVTDACLQDALKHRDGGIRGDMTEDERRKFKRRLARQLASKK